MIIIVAEPTPARRLDRGGLSLTLPGAWTEEAPIL